MASTYILLGLGYVLGAATIGLIIIWRRALTMRERERYFADVGELARKVRL